MIGRPEPRRDHPPSGDRVDPLPPGLRPARDVFEGRYARLEPLDPGSHGAALYAVSHADEAARRVWDYLPYGPFATEATFRAWVSDQSAAVDPLFYAIRDRQSDSLGGVASYLNVEPEQGTIEIGHIWFGPALQKTAAATEALFLLLRHALDDLGYRRMEWKCNALNAASRRAAVRLGFAFEGIFYQHRIVKGHNRDTAWYSILDGEWPAIRTNFATWLAPDNFDGSGRQRRSLTDLNRATRERWLAIGHGGQT